MPPSPATIQYPRPSAVGAIPVTAETRGTLPIEPKKAASPKANSPPSLATIQ